MPIMLPSLSLNHAARVVPVVAMPLWVLRPGKSYSSNTTPRDCGSLTSASMSLVAKPI